MLDGVVIDPLVHLGRRHARGNALGHHVKHTDVDGRGALDALDVLRRLEQVTIDHLLAIEVALLEALVDGRVALLVLLAAAAPARLVAARDRFVVIHG